MGNKRVYTEAIHAERVLAILEKEDTCNRCPAQKGYNACTDEGVMALWTDKRPKDFPCTICKVFIGNPIGCPCDFYGPTLAAKMTWIALEEKGYLKQKEEK